MLKYSPGSRLKIEEVRRVLRSNGYRKNIYKKTDIQQIIAEHTNLTPDFDKYYFYDIAIADDRIEWSKALDRARTKFDREVFPANKWDTDYEIFVTAYALCETQNNKCEARMECRQILLDMLDDSTLEAWNKKVFVPKQYKQYSKYIGLKIDDGSI